MIFDNPVVGTIRPHGWPRPAGNHEPAISQPFRGLHGGIHDGLDISTRSFGSKILAARGGRARVLKNDGIYVVIDHANEFRTLYGHLQDAKDVDGKRVERGQVIGHLGCSGTVIPPGPDGAHLHFEVFLDSGRRINPWPLLVQNVKVRPKDDDGIRLRSELSMEDASIFATTKNSRIIRADGKDLGATSKWRPWGGNVRGPEYMVGITPSDKWRRIVLDGHILFIAALWSFQSET